MEASQTSPFFLSIIKDKILELQAFLGLERENFKLLFLDSEKKEAFVKKITLLDDKYIEQFAELDKYFNLSLIGGEFYEKGETTAAFFIDINRALSRINQYINLFDHDSDLKYSKIFKVWETMSGHVGKLIQDYSTLIKYTQSNVLTRSQKELNAEYESLFDIHEIKRLIEEAKRNPEQQDISYPLFRINIYLFKIDNELSCGDEALKQLVIARQIISNTTRSVIGDILNDKCLYLMKKIELRRSKSDRLVNSWTLADGESIIDKEIHYYKKFDDLTIRHYLKYEAILNNSQEVRNLIGEIFTDETINLITLHLATKILKRKNDVESLIEIFEKFKRLYERQANVGDFDRIAYITGYLLLQNAVFHAKFETLIVSIKENSNTFSQARFKNSLIDIIEHYNRSISHFDVIFKRLNFKISYDGLELLDKLFKVEDFKMEDYVDDDLLQKIVQFTGDLRKNAKDHLQREKRNGDLPFYLTLKKSIITYKINEPTL